MAPPIGVSGLLNREDLKQWILRRLGEPLQTVELTEDHLNDAVTDALRWFVSKKGIRRFGNLTKTPGQVEYPLPDEVDEVLEVYFQQVQPTIATAFDPFYVTDGQIPYNIFGDPGQLGILSSYDQILSYLKQSARVLGYESDWAVDRERRCLFIFPAGTPGASVGQVVYVYSPKNIVLEQLQERDHDIVKRYALEFALRDLGTIRSKQNEYLS